MNPAALLARQSRSPDNYRGTFCSLLSILQYAFYPIQFFVLKYPDSPDLASGQTKDRELPSITQTPA